MLQTSFPKLKKHHPTRLYMLYPMAQSVAQFGVEIDKKMPLQWHLSIVIIHRPSSKNKNHFGARARSYQIRNERSPCAQFWCHINN
jgi:hypothetical protein